MYRRLEIFGLCSCLILRAVCLTDALFSTCSYNIILRRAAPEQNGIVGNYELVTLCTGAATSPPTVWRGVGQDEDTVDRALTIARIDAMQQSVVKD